MLGGFAGRPRGGAVFPATVGFGGMGAVGSGAVDWDVRGGGEEGLGSAERVGAVGGPVRAGAG